MTKTIRILCLSSDAAQLELAAQTLRNESDQFHLTTVTHGQECQNRIASETFDVLLIHSVDFSSELIDLLDLANPIGGSPPAIVLADPADEHSPLICSREGAVDYVVNSTDRIQRLPFAIRIAIEQHQLRVERHKAQADLQTLTSELERRISDRTAQLAAANDELEAFSYSVSHDLRAPLRAIEGFARILVEDFSAHLPPDAKRCVDIILNSTDQMNRLIEDLLAFSRLTRIGLAKTEIDMSALAQSVVVEAQRNPAYANTRIIINPLLPAVGDASMIRQVFANLIGNALKFSRKHPQPSVEIGSYRDAEDRVYFVKDNGVGFDMQYTPKLFTVFQRLHRPDQFEGTGVGLAIVKRILSRHKGRAWAQAQPDAGATFFFSLPAP